MTMTNNIDDSSSPTVGIRQLPTAMAAAAFLGITWYLCIELNVRLFFKTTRRSLYFWSCFLCSGGLIIHTISILLGNFDIWKNYSSMIFMNASWCVYVNAQSLVLYSRLNLIVSKPWVGRYILCMIVVNGVIFGIGTMIISDIAWHPKFVLTVGSFSMTWDKIQIAAFFIQETIISLVYIRETRHALSNMSALSTRERTRRKMRRLIYINILIICLDITLLGVCYAGFFFLQGYCKAAVYAIKVRLEFTILNQLRASLPSASQPRSTTEYTGIYPSSGPSPLKRKHQKDNQRESQDSQTGIIDLIQQQDGLPTGLGGIRVQKDIEVYEDKKDLSGSSDISEP